MKLVVTETTDGYEECIHTVDLSHVTTLEALNRQVIKFVSSNVELVWYDSRKELDEWLSAIGVDSSKFDMNCDFIEIDALSITEKDFFKFVKEWNSTFSDIHNILFEIRY